MSIKVSLLQQNMDKRELRKEGDKRTDRNSIKVEERYGDFSVSTMQRELAI